MMAIDTHTSDFTLLLWSSFVIYMLRPFYNLQCDQIFISPKESFWKRQLKPFQAHKQLLNSKTLFLG